MDLKTYNWEGLGQLVGGLILFLGSIAAMIKSQRRSDGKPPAHRDPTPNEIRECLKDIKSILAKHREIGDEAAESIEERLDKIKRHLDRNEDRIESLTRIIERIDANQRFESAASQWRRTAAERDRNDER